MDGLVWSYHLDAIKAAYMYTKKKQTLLTLNWNGNFSFHTWYGGVKFDPYIQFWFQNKIFRKIHIFKLLAHVILVKTQIFR